MDRLTATIGILAGVLDELSGLTILQQVSPQSFFTGLLIVLLGGAVLATSIYVFGIRDSTKGLQMLTARMENRRSVFGRLMVLYGVIMLGLGIAMVGRVISMVYATAAGIAMMLFGIAMSYRGYDMAFFREQICAECVLYDQLNLGMLLIEGPSGSGKTALVRAFVRLAIENKRPILYVATQTPSAVITNSLERAAGAPVPTELLHVLDCYSYAIGSGAKSFPPGNVTEVNIELQNELRQLARPYLVLDSIDTFALDAGEETTLKFVRNVVARSMSRNAVGAATLIAGAHSSRFHDLLRTMFQGIVELKVEESKKAGVARYLRIFALKGAHHTTEWHPFTINEKGIVLGSSDYRERLPGRHQELHLLQFG